MVLEPEEDAKADEDSQSKNIIDQHYVSSTLSEAPRSDRTTGDVWNNIFQRIPKTEAY